MAKPKPSKVKNKEPKEAESKGAVKRKKRAKLKKSPTLEAEEFVKKLRTTAPGSIDERQLISELQERFNDRHQLDVLPFAIWEEIQATINSKNMEKSDRGGQGNVSTSRQKWQAVIEAMEKQAEKDGPESLDNWIIEMAAIHNEKPFHCVNKGWFGFDLFTLQKILQLFRHGDLELKAVLEKFREVFDEFGEYKAHMRWNELSREPDVTDWQVFKFTYTNPDTNRSKSFKYSGVKLAEAMEEFERTLTHKRQLGPENQT
tara:strand:- start:3204 stop:3980 length:777 start_codon:yes stop_codon:yes gene_type:complete